jgi:HSP20 family protein
MSKNCLQTVLEGYNACAIGRDSFRGEAEKSKEVGEMALSPFRGFYDMQSEMNRMFDEVFGGLARRGGQQGEDQTQWAPALDVLQEDGDIVVRAELPGVKLEDVDITLQNGVLTISGERRAEDRREGSGYYVRERRFGSFRRSMTLPQGVDESKISARFDGGVLEVRVSGAAAVQEPRRIQIEGGDESSGNGTSGG